MKVSYDHNPSILEAVGNGSYRYRYNIEEQTVEQHLTEDSDTAAASSRTGWVCDEVIVWAPLTSNKIKQAVMEKMCPPTHELKLTHEYNAAMNGITGGSKTSEAAKTAIARYKEFLTNRTELLALVQSNCDELGIK